MTLGREGRAIWGGEGGWREEAGVSFCITRTPTHTRSVLNRFILFVVLINIITMAADGYPETEPKASILEIFNMVFTALYVGGGAGCWGGLSTIACPQCSTFIHTNTTDVCRP